MPGSQFLYKNPYYESAPSGNIFFYGKQSLLEVGEEEVHQADGAADAENGEESVPGDQSAAESKWWAGLHELLTWKRDCPIRDGSRNFLGGGEIFCFTEW